MSFKDVGGCPNFQSDVVMQQFSLVKYVNGKIELTVAGDTDLVIGHITREVTQHSIDNNDGRVTVEPLGLSGIFIGIADDAIADGAVVRQGPNGRLMAGGAGTIRGIAKQAAKQNEHFPYVPIAPRG